MNASVARPRLPSPSQVIGITMGCPVGIGPEIVLRFLAETGEIDGFRPIVLGDPGVLDRCARELAIKVEIMPWRPGQAAPPPAAGLVPVLALSQLDADRLVWGQPDAGTGRAMAAYIKEAVQLSRQGVLAGLVTCPIAKAALQLAGYDFPGHTEMLATLCGVTEYAMMLAGSKLRVTLVTIHVPLASVPGSITPAAIGGIIRLTHAALKEDFGIKQPRLAVAALNPHAGENGLFGKEESALIRPGIAAAAAGGWPAQGPFPPDTVFYRAAAGEFDAVVCMYHDQGLIPFKLLHFVDGVNVTLGLPIVRTSVDHGTAYDIAGRGLANPASLRAAVALAATIVTNRRRKRPGRAGKGGGGLLIAFEGIDGTGKSTQLRLLAEELEAAGLAVVATREPTTGPYGQKIRQLYASRAAVSPAEELELFLADRRQHVAEVIGPALAAGKIVLTDRYYFSTVAYQGAAGLDPDLILEKNAFAPVPDLTFLLIVPTSLGLQRIRSSRGEVPNAFEQEAELLRVAAVFDKLAAPHIKRIDGTRSVAQVHRQIMAHVKQELLLRTEAARPKGESPAGIAKQG